ncbi:four helix bundle protein [Aquimarina algiphila]|uniref:four helix bundle protein n=1 Tax=Aquimarina algiphila TaxID=2047982 RepID=UPI00232C601D|nr:four helix bundle protein [Aquimarina algiphila]
MSTFRNLKIWSKAMDIVTKVYSDTNNFPKEEMYGLTSQIRRACVSIPSNIAEGYGRKGKKEYLRFLNIAMSSLFEMQTQLEIAKNLKYMNTDKFETMYDETRELERMLSSYNRKVESSI